MSFDWSRRAVLTEEMERPDCHEDKLILTLRHFAALNLLISRYRSLLTRTVLADMRRTPGCERVLADIGAGGGDIGRWLVRRTRRLGVSLRVIAIENDERVFRYAHSANAGYPEIDTVHADLFDTRFWDGVDYVFANHVLHHLSDQHCIDLLRQLDRTGLRRYVISDLLRSVWSYRAFAVFIAPLFPGSFVGIDGLASIRRGFTLPEVRSLIQCAEPVHPPIVQRLFPGRIVIEGGRS